MTLPWLLLFALHASGIRLEGKVANGQRVVVDDGRVALKLPGWSSVERLLVSPSKKHAFLFVHTERGKPRRGFFIDLASAKVTGVITPGVGGAFTFTPSETILQEAGCGTECASLAIHAPNGQTLGTFGCDGFDAEHELAPDRRFAACFNRHRVTVIDTATGKSVASQETDCLGGSRDGVRIESGKRELRFTCPRAPDENGERPAARLLVTW